MVKSEADERKTAGVLDVGEIRKSRQRSEKRYHRPTMSGKREDCPGQAPRSCQGWSSAFQPLHAALYNRILCSIIQG